VTKLETLNAAGLLKSHGFRPRHRLGQNFLEDQGALELIVSAAGIEPQDAVLEIGSGFGSLTAHLASKAGSVIAVEVDSQLVTIAADYLRAFKNVRLVCADILELSADSLGLPPAFIAAANIPYYVTSPILRHLLESSVRPRRIVLTVQQEVASRICSGPPEMSLLSLSVQLYGRPEIVARLPAHAFYPVPKVDSAIVRIEAYDTPLVSSDLLPLLFSLARAGFQQKRKTLRNSIASGLRISAGDAANMLSSAGIDPQRRAQTVSLEEWKQLAALGASRLPR
jgi:16S rRNA (adenine1518-N6/adenine1519-N6)-dimethyltransferase